MELRLYNGSHVSFVCSEIWEKNVCILELSECFGQTTTEKPLKNPILPHLFVLNLLFVQSTRWLCSVCNVHILQAPVLTCPQLRLNKKKACVCLFMFSNLGLVSSIFEHFYGI